MVLYILFPLHLDISLCNGNGSNEFTEAQLPVPGGPGGPAVPYFEIPEEYITTTNGEIRGMFISLAYI